MSALPPWATELALLYESHATNQFLLAGNVADDFFTGGEVGSLENFLLRALLPNFEVVLAYDLGNGLRVVKGAPIFSEWRGAVETFDAGLRRPPRAAIETITHYLRYVANLGELGRKCPQTAVLVHSAHLIAPALPQALNYDLSALALLLRDWSRDEALRRHPIATFLVTENLTELHPMLATNPDASRVTIPQPDSAALAATLREKPDALGAFADREDELATQLAGASLKSVRRLLRRQAKEGRPLAQADIAKVKKSLIESEGGALVEFLEPTRTLDDFEGQPALKNWLRQDLALWRRGDLRALPMGYLLCGPVGTGKTYAVECLAGEAGVPVLKLGNFRDRWVGSTEGNLEKIFRLLRALDRCFVFIDEADQTLGRRDSGTNDAGLSGRVYSMFAQEMSRRENRGRIVWILASSRPDLIEVDLKRPGRVDVKIPILPTATPAESFALLRALARRLDLPLDDALLAPNEAALPTWLTPGAAEALSLKLYRLVHAAGRPLPEAFAEALRDYQPPVAREVMKFQIGLAVSESSDAAFVPEAFRSVQA